jgi:hypothetical protein
MKSLRCFFGFHNNRRYHGNDDGAPYEQLICQRCGSSTRKLYTPGFYNCRFEYNEGEGFFRQPPAK